MKRVFFGAIAALGLAVALIAPASAATGPSAKQVSDDLVKQCHGKKVGTVVKALNGRNWTCFARKRGMKKNAAAPKPANPTAPPLPKQKSSVDRVLDAVGQPLQTLLEGGTCALRGGAIETRSACGAKKS